MIKIFYSSHFTRSLKKLPTSVRQEADRGERQFREDPFTPALKTHKLKGRHSELWSFSITYQHRIVFRFLDNHAVLFIRLRPKTLVLTRDEGRHE
ncbi:MAG: type II toxin-antitoxin system YoeB family toxin [Candidatus Doudnabacteria bacterium]|nr:type II toxin-antitoxin system YoeB family toxin [Candidatus Doudnabacteria bacterium]